MILDPANDLILWDQDKKGNSYKASRAAADFFLGKGGFDGILFRSVWDWRESERNAALLKPGSILEMVVAEECVKLNRSSFGAIVVNGTVELGQIRKKRGR
ncbi:RES domain-containing protein [Methanomassiliicoccales archaeon LGM-RCC1]|nr:RES domain-containing protein [Methanomassiliicoccales archaeon LGM-RCC1]